MPTDNSSRPLGRRPHDPVKVRERSLHLKDFLTGQLPPYPIADVSSVPGPWPMDGNDRYGDCVVAMVDHGLQIINQSLGVQYTNWSTAKIVDYYRSQNPDFDPSGGPNGPGSDADGGMIVQDFLSYLAKEGTLLGFASFDPTNEAEVKAATWLFLSPFTGVDLQVAQQTQATWDYVPGSPEWGGHAIPLLGYRGVPDDFTCVTWGDEGDMTARFVRLLMSEAWVPVTRELVDHPDFRAGFDLVKFAEAYTEITGRPFPIEPPPPPPPPEPPGPGSWWDAVVAFLAKIWDAIVGFFTQYFEEEPPPAAPPPPRKPPNYPFG